MTLNITTLSITTLSIATNKMRHTANVFECCNAEGHKSALYAEGHYVQCHYAECRGA
jgi:hypothetical protein